MLNKTPPVSDLMMDQQMFTWQHSHVKSLHQHWDAVKAIGMIMIRERFNAPTVKRLSQIYLNAGEDMRGTS